MTTSLTTQSTMTMFYLTIISYQTVSLSIIDLQLPQLPHVMLPSHYCSHYRSLVAAAAALFDN